MMAGVVPGDVVARLQSRLLAQPDAYPWEEVVDAVLDEPVGDSELVNKGLVAQRNWLLRGSRGDLDRDATLRAVGQLALAVKTVQRLCVEKGLCTEAEFHRRLREIDAEDGRSDGMSSLPQ